MDKFHIEYTNLLYLVYKSFIMKIIHIENINYYKNTGVLL